MEVVITEEVVVKLSDREETILAEAADQVTEVIRTEEDIAEIIMMPEVDQVTEVTTGIRVEAEQDLIAITKEERMIIMVQNLIIEQVLPDLHTTISIDSKQTYP